MERIKYLASSTIESLRTSIAANARRYREGDFTDLMKDGEWSVELQQTADLSPLSELDPSGKPEAEAENSMRVWAALGNLSPSLAYEEGIWVRLTHVECLEFSRQRWLSASSTDETLTRDVRLHFFADTLNRRRDDNAISRLWWNAYMAHGISPGDPRSALKLILSRADMRANLIERSLTGTRKAIVRGILRIASASPKVTNSERNFRRFMVTLNKLGGGQIFEAMSDQELDAFLSDCVEKAEIGEPSLQLDDA